MNRTTSPNSYNEFLKTSLELAMRFGNPIKAESESFLNGVLIEEEIIGKEAELVMSHLGRTCLLRLTVYDEKLGNIENQSLVNDAIGPPLVKLIVHTDEEIPVTGSSASPGIHGIIDVSNINTAYYDFYMDFSPESGMSTIGVPASASTIRPLTQALGFEPSEILVADYECVDIDLQRGEMNTVQLEALTKTLLKFTNAGSTYIEI